MKRLLTIILFLAASLSIGQNTIMLDAVNIEPVSKSLYPEAFATVTMDVASYSNSVIYYTIDGDVPTQSDLLYTNSFEVFGNAGETVNIKAIQTCCFGNCCIFSRKSFDR